MSGWNSAERLGSKKTKGTEMVGTKGEENGLEVEFYVRGAHTKKEGKIKKSEILTVGVPKRD